MEKAGLAAVGAFLILVFIPIGIAQWMAATIFFTILMARAYISLVMARLTFERLEGGVARTFRLSDTTIRLKVHNPLPFRIPYLLIHDETGGLIRLDPSVAVLSLNAGESLIFSYRIRSDRRGCYTLGPATLVFSDPFGFFRRNIALSEPHELVVLPRIIPVQKVISAGLPIGSLRSQNPLDEDPGRLRSLRDYQAGDDPRRIHWKASARNTELQVKELAPTLNSSGTIVLNLNAAQYHGRGGFVLFERSLEVAASLAAFWADKGLEIGWVINQQQPAVLKKGKNQVSFFLDLLARLESFDEQAVPLEDVFSGLSFSPENQLVLISPAITKQTYQKLENLVPGSTVFEYWLLQARSSSPDNIDVHHIPGSKKRSIIAVREYGDNLHD